MSRKGKMFTVIRDEKKHKVIINKRYPSDESRVGGANIARNNISEYESAVGLSKDSKPFVRLAHETHLWLGFHLQPGMYFGLDSSGYFIARPQDSRFKSHSELTYSFMGMPVYRISECGEWACSIERNNVTAKLHDRYLQRLLSGTFPVWDRREDSTKISKLYQYGKPIY